VTTIFPGKLLFTAVLGTAVLALGACTPDGGDQPAVASAGAVDTSTNTGAPSTSASTGGSAATVADVASRYPSCEAIGALLGSALDGMEPDDASTFDTGSIQCAWLSTASGSGDLGTVSVAVDPNGGAEDITAPDVLASIGAEQVPDAGIESQGGIAYLMPGSGDLRITVTLVDVPGVSLSITQGVLGADPTFVGPTGARPSAVHA
jgi:hypothetical protein